MPSTQSLSEPEDSIRYGRLWKRASSSSSNARGAQTPLRQTHFVDHARAWNGVCRTPKTSKGSRSRLELRFHRRFPSRIYSRNKEFGICCAEPEVRGELLLRETSITLRVACDVYVRVVKNDGCPMIEENSFRNSTSVRLILVRIERDAICAAADRRGRQSCLRINGLGCHAYLVIGCDEVVREAQGVYGDQEVSYSICGETGGRRPFFFDFLVIAPKIGALTCRSC